MTEKGLMERFKLGDGRYLQVHDKRDCAGRFCVIHHPSDHLLKNAPLSWRGDRGMMERICRHGVGHPDPDDLAYKRMILGEHYAGFEFGVHGCDGCCGVKDQFQNEDT